ncbi:hypothetical protein [Streptomyces indicus]|uniref:Uncharacterized protein n=1 Tax=Streptomyces indicus TaxID=417292 RepID=A0A1G8Z796_9ACTN|nr:hypothetical protein [Streptomyces indicus]SDK10959.1 hypothetical protein SAMN05421806_104484 [Streptomyces indicus]
MEASWTSKTPGRLIGIVDDTGELLPGGEIVPPHRPLLTLIPSQPEGPIRTQPQNRPIVTVAA